MISTATFGKGKLYIWDEEQGYWRPIGEVQEVEFNWNRGENSGTDNA